MGTDWPGRKLLPSDRNEGNLFAGRNLFPIASCWPLRDSFSRDDPLADFLLSPIFYITTTDKNDLGKGDDDDFLWGA